MRSQARISPADSDTNFNSPKESHDGSDVESDSSITNYTALSTTFSTAIHGPRTVIVMRHGERVDDLFPDWIERCADAPDYIPYDSNMPPTLQPLKRSVQDFKEDTPLTQMGNIMAQMVGRGLLINDMVPTSIYTSPAFRCVQTAAAVASMCDSRCKIRVEPGFFENNDLYPDSKPTWLKAEELQSAGFDVDLNYQPFFTHEDIWFHKEDAKSYNQRINTTLDEILKNEKKINSEGCILICAHASSVDLSVGYFAMPRRFITDNDLVGIGNHIPYCCTAVFRHQRSTTPYGAWRYYGESALPQITYSGFTSRPNYEFLLRKTSPLPRG